MKSLMQRPVAQRAVAPSSSRRPVAAPLRSRVMTRVAAVEKATSSPDPNELATTASSKAPLRSLNPAELAEMELAELDSTQEQLLAWMMFTDEKQKEEDLDEMVDYDEFGDEEYEELFEEVEELIEARDEELKVGDKVMGTVYEVDDDGAYVEIGQKASGFVPLAECSFAKLKTVGYWGQLGLGLHGAWGQVLHGPC